MAPRAMPQGDDGGGSPPLPLRYAKSIPPRAVQNAGGVEGDAAPPPHVTHHHRRAHRHHRQTGGIEPADLIPTAPEVPSALQPKIGWVALATASVLGALLALLIASAQSLFR